MANRTLSITAPEDLMQPTIVAYAAEAGVDVENATQEELEEGAKATLKADMRDKTLGHNDNARRLAAKEGFKQQRQAEEEALTAASELVVVEFKSE